MINVAENLQDGDIVYAWFSQFKEKGNKKPHETEYHFYRFANGGVKLVNDSGDSWMIIPKELMDNWVGNIRKA